MKGILGKILMRRRPIPNIGKVAIGFVGFWMAVWYSKRLKLSEAQYLFQNTSLNEEILNRMNIFGKDYMYSPNIFLFNGFLQAMYASWFEDREYLHYDSQKVEGFGEIYRFPLHQQIKKRSLKSPLIIFILGAEGMSQAVTNAIKQCYYHKMQVVALNPNDLHNTQAVSQIVQQIKKSYEKNEGQNIYGVGYQYGGNLLVNTAAQHENLFSGIVTLGNPLDLATAEKQIEGSRVAKLFYYKDLLNGRKNRVQQQKSKIPKDVKLSDIDKHVYNIVKQSDALSQKQKNSSINKISKITVPYLLIQSAEDQFATKLEDERIENSKVICIETKRGGHHEWLQGYTTIMRWGTRVVLQFIKANEHIRNQKANLLI